MSPRATLSHLLPLESLLVVAVPTPDGHDVTVVPRSRLRRRAALMTPAYMVRVPRGEPLLVEAVAAEAMRGARWSDFADEP